MTTMESQADPFEAFTQYTTGRTVLEVTGETRMGKVTMYFQGGFGMAKVEASRAKIEVKPHAQYARGIYVDFLPKRARRERSFVQAYRPSLVVLEGWGHPDPDSAFLPAKPGGEPGVTVSEGRYSACDPRWQSDFDAKLAAYLEASGAKVLHDFRGHEPGVR
jgi:hypothetical protein